MRTAIVLLTVSIAFAQAPDNVVSPEVKSGGMVTFRIRAPKASDVTFFGDWMKPNTSEKFIKGESGVWSVTLGPIPPGIYLYSFTVDGVQIADPVNPRIKLRARTSAS